MVAQWYNIPNDDLTTNLTGATFDGDEYNPKITLPRVYKPVTAVTLFIWSKTKRFTINHNMLLPRLIYPLVVHTVG